MLQYVATLDPDTLVAEVKKARGNTKPLTVAGLTALQDEQARSIVPPRKLAAEAPGRNKKSPLWSTPPTA
jgi:hypothetical protein